MNAEISRKLTNSILLVRIIFGALLFGIVSFLTAMSIIITPNNEQSEMNELFQVIAPVLMAIAGLIGIFFKRALLKRVQHETNPLNLIRTFTSTKMVQLGLMDAAIIFAIVCFVLTSNTYFILLSGIGILYFITLFPLQNKVIQQLKLDNPVGY